MMAFFLAILTDPTDRMVVTTAGSASGMEPTASATPIPKSTAKDSPEARPITTMAINAKRAAIMMKMVSRSTCLVSGVFSTFCPDSMWAMWPTSEPMPVVVTRISPWPRVTFVFMNAMFRRSPMPTSCRPMVSVSFSTATLSPVRAPSSIWRVAARMIRPSAGTRSPASTTTMSPGTICSAGSSTTSPSRRTLAIAFIICPREAAASSALPSWWYPSHALNSVSRASPMAVPYSAISKLTRAATTRTICM
ncbi:hypothetical protein SRABI128_03952 [Microbacterium sp. Bi128]|nr:hypothetical protein SRABI128_03952 [Microbacterium sp. Bi128]